MRPDWTSTICAVAAIGALGACAPEPAEEQTEALASEATPAPVEAPEVEASPLVDPYAEWEGRWIGVEGMFADIRPNGDGTYTIEMQSDLDTRGTYQGVAVEDGIRFERDGESFVLRTGTGEETGLKWLLDKSDCLVVQEGEGYCRD
ncbi:hypothetical protein [Qipengyuania sp. MTN3-11]|uniref:hypothetical protein n=1 Tax=Qipengyuania sp. MTN3-11 TaxID=3056557 RepID=UPI0036F1EC39